MFWEKMPSHIKIYLFRLGAWAGYILGHVASFYDALLSVRRDGAKKLTIYTRFLPEDIFRLPWVYRDGFGLSELPMVGVFLAHCCTSEIPVDILQKLLSSDFLLPQKFFLSSSKMDTPSLSKYYLFAKGAHVCIYKPAPSFKLPTIITSGSEKKKKKKLGVILNSSLSFIS